MKQTTLKENRPPREPEHLKELMRAWRGGYGEFPQAYVRYHRDLAEDRMEELKVEYGITVLRCRMVNEGWGDQMRVVELVVETRTGRLMHLQWNDSNREFMKRSKGGGHSILFKEDLL